MIKIKAASRLRAMAFARKTAMDLFTSRLPSTLFKHYILVHTFPNNTETNHWKKECRTFIEDLLEKTELKSGTFTKADFLRYLWVDYAGTVADCEGNANRIFTVEGMSKLEREKMRATLDFYKVSRDYKAWLTKWYDYYHNPHGGIDRHDLPISLF